MRLTKVLVVAALFVLRIAEAQAQLYAVVSAEGGSPDADKLLVLNPADGTIIDRIPLTLSGGGTVDGVVGIAAHPQTRVLYIILDTSPRSLATVNPATGIVTPIGSLGEYFSGLTFAPDGTLYAIAGNANNTDTAAVHTVNLSTAATTLFRASESVLAGGFPSPGGNSIDFNTADGRLYFSGTFSFDELLRMDLQTKLATVVPTDDVVNAQAMTFDPDTGTFLMWEESSADEFFRVDPRTGEVTILNTNISEGNSIRGLELMPTPRTTAPTMNGIGAALTALVLCLIGVRAISRAH